MSLASSAERSAQRRQTVLLASVAIGVYGSLCAWLYFGILTANGGHFVYALDDPYIHLALSDEIARGHYGINPHEFSSPSSSLLWPFLLAPFARFPWQDMVPLVLNILASLGVAGLAGAAVARWPTPAGASENGSAFRSEETWRRVLSAVGLVFIANLLGLTFVGMEHTLQVLLAGAGAWGIIACLRGRPVPLWCLAAVAVGPAVRYENLGISLALAIALAGQRQLRRAAGLLLVSLLPLLMFSFYLHHLGLPWVPTSVLVKSRVPKPAGGLGTRGLQLIGDNAGMLFTDPQRLVVLILLLTLAFLAYRQTERGRRFALWGAAVATGLHLLVGRFGWFHRYEVYIVFFGALIVLHVMHERARGLLGWYALGLLGCSFVYFQAFREVVLAANQIYRQDYQTHRFLNDFYTGDVAVNDLGLVSYHRRPGMYVLDLWGLGSEEAARETNKTTVWMDGIVSAHHVGLAVIYPMWFPPVPADWTLLGDLCLSDSPVVLGGDCVSFYATPAASLPELQDEFDDFISTLPRGLTIRPANEPRIYR